jgi:hypothetical protein
MNIANELGDGTTIQRTEPVQIGTATNWTDVETGGAFSLGRSAPWFFVAATLVVAGVIGERPGLGRADALGVARYLPGTCSVPPLLGKTLAAAKRLLAAGNCRLGRRREAPSSRVQKGRVLSQSDRAGAMLADYAVVGVVVSRGRKR